MKTTATTITAKKKQKQKNKKPLPFDLLTSVFLTRAQTATWFYHTYVESDRYTLYSYL